MKRRDRALVALCLAAAVGIPAHRAEAGESAAGPNAAADVETLFVRRIAPLFAAKCGVPWARRLGGRGWSVTREPCGSTARR